MCVRDRFTDDVIPIDAKCAQPDHFSTRAPGYKLRMTPSSYIVVRTYVQKTLNILAESVSYASRREHGILSGRRTCSPPAVGGGLSLFIPRAGVRRKGAVCRERAEEALDK